MATITYCRENQISSGCLYTHALGILKLLDPDLTPGGERLTNYFIKDDPIFRYGDLSYNNSRMLASNLNNIAAEKEREEEQERKASAEKEREEADKLRRKKKGCVLM